MDKDLKGKDQGPTHVGRGILISGRIEGEGDVIVEGRINGEVNIRGDLQIEYDGQVKADIQARNIYVQGILVGNAEAYEKLEIADGGRMVGDITSPRVLINEGAAFSGLVDMEGLELEERAEARAPRRSPSRPPVSSTKRGGQPRSMPRAPSTPPPAFGQGKSAASQRTPELQAPERSPAKNLYTPPPLPKPPELSGVRKAIIIKKKSPDGN